MKLAVIGAGYVGLVVAACLADAGNTVALVDHDAERIRTLRAGEVPIHEPGLAPLLQNSASAGRLSFTTATPEAISTASVVFIAVGTPPGAGGLPNTEAVHAAARTIAASATGPLLVAIKSTVPVGTHAELQALFNAECAHPVEVASNPEFLKEGCAVADFMSPDRVLIGSTDPGTIATLRRLYAPFMRRSDRVVAMAPASAELTKYASNTMLALRVAFINDISRLAERVGADITEVRTGVGTDSRIGPHFLHASLGFGGSCLPKDVNALAAMGRAAGQPQHIAEATARANLAQQDHFFARILAHFSGRLDGRRIGVWGLAYKARTDDLRESPALRLVERLLEAGATVRAHDPAALARTAAALSHPSLTLHPHAYDAVTNIDALIIGTEWQEYRSPDLPRLHELMAQPVVFDGRNLYDPDWMAAAGFHYTSVGRPSAAPSLA